MAGKQKTKNLALKYTPNILLDIYCSYQGLVRYRQRYNRLFNHYYNFYCQVAKWSESQLIDYQNQRLREIVAYCYENVPYYKNVFDKIGLKPFDIRTIEDLGKIPFLDKIKVRQAGTELVSREFDPKKLFKSHTSGSTGTPMLVYFSPETCPAQWGFVWARARPGVRRGDRYASFQSQLLVEPDRKKPPFWRMNYIAKQRLYSVWHLQDENLKYYFEDLNSFKPEYIQGYPSAMYIVAEYMKRKGLFFAHQLKAALSIFETVQGIHKETIEEVWQCPLWDQYGQGERVGIITLYECGNYHYDMDFSIIEFIPVENNENEEIAEIVGTSFINKAWTLLRYRTGDLVLIDRNSRCHCGRPGPVIKSVIGRTGDIITTPDGRRVMNVTSVVRDVPGLVELQVVHSKVDEIIINVARSSSYNQDSENTILSRLGDSFGPSIALKINYVDRIERTSGGKFKAIVSKL